MSVTQTRTLRVIDYESQTAPQLSAENAHILRFAFGDGQKIYIPSQDGLNYPAGAVVSDARIAINGISSITDNAGVQSNIATISGCTVTLADVGYDLASRISNKLANGVGTRHKTIEIFSQHPDEYFSEDNLLHTFILEGYDNTKDGKRKILTLTDVARETASNIFENKEWTLVNSVAEDDMFIDVSAGDDDDYRFQRGPDDNRYPNENIGYMSFGSGTDREIWSYSDREKLGDNWYRYTVRDRACFDSSLRSFVIDPDEPIENNETVKEFVYYREDCRDALLMATNGTARDGRQAPSHWTPNASLVDINSIASSRFDDIVEIEEPGEQEAKTFYEKYILIAMSDSVMAINRKGELQLQPVDPAPPDADAKVYFDENNIDISSLSPLKIKQSGLANPIVAYWDYNPITEDFQNKVIRRDLNAESIHGKGELLDVEMPSFHTGSHSGSQIEQRLQTVAERYGYPTVTISFDAIPSMRWVASGTLVRLTVPDGVVIDDSSGELTTVDRTFLVIGRRYNPSTRKVRYFLWGTSGEAIAQSNSTLSSHIPDSEFFRDATNIATVLPVVDGVLSGGGHVIAPGNYYYDGSLRLAPDFECGFSRRGAKFSLRVTGVLTAQSPNPWLAKGMGIHKGGAGASGTQRLGEPGEAGYFGRSVGGGGFDVTVQYQRGPRITENIPLYSIAGYEATSTQGVTNPPSMTESAPFFSLSLNGDQFTGIPADLSGCGGAGGSAIWKSDSGRDGKAAQENNLALPFGANDPPVATFEIVLNGRDGEYGGMGIEYWSRGGGWDGDGGIDVSGADSDIPTGAAYQGLATGAPGPSYPGVFAWIMDDPSALLPDVSSARVTANTGAVHLEGERAGNDPFYRAAAVVDPVLRGYHESNAQQNLASTAAVAMYSPVPATLSRRYSNAIDRFFANQRDGKVKIFTGTKPSDANYADAYITTEDLNGNEVQPYFEVFTSAGWVEYDWVDDDFKSLYSGLINMLRVYGGTSWTFGETFPVEFNEGDSFTDEISGNTYILNADGNHELILRGDTAVGDERNTDFALFNTAQTYEADGFLYYVGLTSADAMPVQSSAKVATSSARPTIVSITYSGAFSAITDDPVMQPPADASFTAYDGSSGELVWTRSSDETEIDGYRIYRDGVEIGSTSGNSLYITGLDSGTTYEFSVVAYGSSGESAPATASGTTAGGSASTGAFAVVSDGPTIEVTGTAAMEGRGLYMEFLAAAGTTVDSVTVNFSSGVVTYTPPNPSSYATWTGYVVDVNGDGFPLPGQPRAYTQ